MAMLALAVAVYPGRVVVATFDHQLRAGSREEAEMVAEACRGLGVTHAVLTAPAPIAGSSLQRQAREARYAALGVWAAAEGACALLTAHHADDQAETLLMRLNRASGLSGLAGVRARRFEGEVLLLRPLLGWRRAELRAVAEASDLSFVDDPSNADPRHDRSRVRTALAAVPELDPARLARSAAWLGDAEEVVAGLAERLWADRWHGPEQGLAMAGEPRELRRRLVRRAILASREAFGISEPAFGDSSNVEPLLDSLEEGRGAVQGGVKVEVSGESWLFRSAPPRRRN